MKRDVAADAKLAALWAEGHSTAEIGRRMGKTKNSIVGRAHRLNLPARQSPIIRTGTGRLPRPYVPRAKKITLDMGEARQRNTGTLIGATLPRDATPPAAPVPLGSVNECAFALNDGHPWRFCCKPTRPGSSWCPAHHARVFLPPRDRRENFIIAPAPGVLDAR